MAIAMAVGGGALVPYAFGVFLKEIAADTGWSRGGVSGAIGLFIITFAVSAPFFGALVDRFGPRPSALVATIIFVGLLAALSLAGSEAALRVQFAVLGFFAVGLTGLPFSKVITAAFTKRRGLAFGLGSSGVGLGGIFLPILSVYLLSAYGWRGGFVGLAVLVAVVGLTVIWVGLRPRPGLHVGTSGGAGRAPGPRPWRTKPYWLLAFSIACITSAVGGVSVHIPAMLTDGGLSAGAAAGVVSLLAVASVIGRVGGGILMDIIFAPWVAAGVFCLAAASFLSLLLAQQGWAGGSAVPIFFGAIAIGLVAGAETDFTNYLVSRYFPIEDFAKTFGFMMFVFTACFGLGVFLQGSLYDRFGSYEVGLLVSTGFAAIGCIAILQLGPYRQSVD